MRESPNVCAGTISEALKQSTALKNVLALSCEIEESTLAGLAQVPGEKGHGKQVRAKTTEVKDSVSNTEL